MDGVSREEVEKINDMITELKHDIYRLTVDIKLAEMNLSALEAGRITKEEFIKSIESKFENYGHIEIVG